MKTKRSPGSFWSKTYVSWLVYGLLALLVVILQMAPRLFPDVAFARPVPLVPFVVCVALFEGARIGAGVGVIAGLLWDVYAFRLFGLDALLLLAIGLTVGLLVQWLLRANFLSAMLLCSGAVLLHSLLEWLFCYVLFQGEELWTVLAKVYLPNAVYTLVLAPLIYWLALATARFLRRRANG
ncbi:MAG: rod shape-determining protein MreD [Clostridia bacterium]|nr:rod shape-determining protein MreD [Clostridia bacterium]